MWALADLNERILFHSTHGTTIKCEWRLPLLFKPARKAMTWKVFPRPEWSVSENQHVILACCLLCSDSPISSAKMQLSSRSYIMLSQLTPTIW